MKKIKLTQGKCALVSDIDYTYLNQWKWYYHRGYARRTDRSGKQPRTILMHRIVLERILAQSNFTHTDHRDLDGLNNQRRNLRPATQQQNGQNRGKQKNNTSGYKGVSWYPRDQQWVAKIRVNQRLLHLGYFTNKGDAAKAYNRAEKKYCGKFSSVRAAV